MANCSLLIKCMCFLPNPALPARWESHEHVTEEGRDQWVTTVPVLSNSCIISVTGDRKVKTIGAGGAWRGSKDHWGRWGRICSYCMFSLRQPWFHLLPCVWCHVVTCVPRPPCLSGLSDQITKRLGSSSCLCLVLSTSDLISWDANSLSPELIQTGFCYLAYPHLDGIDLIIKTTLSVFM